MSADSNSTRANAEVLWRFGSFVLWESQRRLERRGQAIRLGSRSFDLLLMLLRRAGELISNEDLHAAVWRGVVVEEASVRVHMSNLRKALGPPDSGDGCREWIANVPLRGYRFVGRVDCEAAQAVARPIPTSSLMEGGEFAKTPARLSRLIGRDLEVDRLLDAVATQRLVTVIGAGGVGKTSVAVAVAERHQARGAGLIGFVDLAPLSSSQGRVLDAIAAALGAPGDAPDLLHAIAERLAGKDVLLLVDNCEHVIDSLSLVIIHLLATLPSLRILATSREALRIEGEHVLRLPPLALPAHEPSSLEEAMRSPAVELLVERALAAGAKAFDDSQRHMLARICRQMDGIPLAIELVAARLGVQAIEDLVHRMDDPMRLYWAGIRAVIPRHRNLAAALDWSLALLDQEELELLRRLSAYPGRFDVGSALVVTACDTDPERATSALISLTAKSLVMFDPDHSSKPYRLLETTRSYAQRLLAQGSECDEASPGHGPPARSAKPSLWPAWSAINQHLHSPAFAS